MFFQPANSRRRFAKALDAPAAVELLENRQLLSVTNDLLTDGGFRQDSSATDASEQTFEVSGYSHDYGFNIRIEEIRVVGDEIWVLSRLDERELIPGLPQGGWSLNYDSDSVTVIAPELNVKEFQIRRDPGDGTGAIRLESGAEFLDQIGTAETELLYSRSAPALTQWRRELEVQFIAQADEQLSHLYGIDWDLRPRFDSANTPNREVQFLHRPNPGSADTIQTDDGYIYAISNQQLTITQVASGNSPATVVSRLGVNRGHKLVLHGDRLALIDAASNRTSITILDISNRHAPSIIQEAIVDGRYESAWLLNDELFVGIENRTPGLPFLGTSPDVTLESGHRYHNRDEYIQSVRETIYGSVDSAPLSPASFYGRNSDGDVRLNALNAPTELGAKFISILRFQMAGLETSPIENIHLPSIGYGSTIRHVADNALYVVGEQQDWVWDEPELTRQQTTQDNGDGITIVRWRKGHWETTSIVTPILVTAKEMVPGNPVSIDGYIHSFDSHEGFLRIFSHDATSASSFQIGQAEEPTFHREISTLQLTNGQLTEVGSLDLSATSGSDVDITFNGDRAWVSIGRYSGELITVDLSDPAAPRISEQPSSDGSFRQRLAIDDNHLLEIGQANDGLRRHGGYHISLFDTSDPSNPTLLHRHTLNEHLRPLNGRFPDVKSLFQYLPEQQLLLLILNDTRHNVHSIPLLTAFRVDSTTGFEEREVQSTLGIRRAYGIGDQLYVHTDTSIRQFPLTDLTTPVTTVSTVSDSNSIPHLFDMPRCYATGQHESDANNMFGSGGVLVPTPPAIAPVITANQMPSITLPSLSSAVSFDLQITNDDGETQTFSEITDSQFEIPHKLPIGVYGIRIRSTDSSANVSRWSVSSELSVAGRPEIELSYNGMSWDDFGASHAEVWVNNVRTGERVYFAGNFSTNDVSNSMATFHLSLDEIQGYDIWVKLVMPDGSKTAWSRKVTVQSQLVERVDVEAVSDFMVGNPQSFRWNSGAGLQSVEVYVRKSGTRGSTYRQDGITGTSHDLTDHLPVGDYQVWFRGNLINGRRTDWGPVQRFSVNTQPPITVQAGIATWADEGAGVQYEVWVNRVDAFGKTVESRVLHKKDVSTNSYDLNQLGNGSYRIWLRSFSGTSSQAILSSWSRAVNFGI